MSWDEQGCGAFFLVCSLPFRAALALAPQTPGVYHVVQSALPLPTWLFCQRRRALGLQAAERGCYLFACLRGCETAENGSNESPPVAKVMAGSAPSSTRVLGVVGKNTLEKRRQEPRAVHDGEGRQEGLLHYLLFPTSRFQHLRKDRTRGECVLLRETYEGPQRSLLLTGRQLRDPHRCPQPRPLLGVWRAGEDEPQLCPQERCV